MDLPKFTFFDTLTWVNEPLSNAEETADSAIGDVEFESLKASVVTEASGSLGASVCNGERYALVPEVRKGQREVYVYYHLGENCSDDALLFSVHQGHWSRLLFINDRGEVERIRKLMKTVKTTRVSLVRP